jgi:outer membrane protein TolC
MSTRRSVFAVLAFLASTVTAPNALGQRSDTVRLAIGDVVAKTLRESDEIRLANTQIDVTEAQFTQARAAALPTLRFAGNYTQVTKNARAAIVSSLFGQSHTYTTNLNLSQPIFQGGRLFAGARAAGDLRGAARNTLAETRSRLSVDAQSAYLGSLLARELVSIQEANVVLAESRLAQVEQLFKAGRTARYDVLKARVERVNLEPGLQQARSDRELADIALRQLLNLPGDAPIVLTTELDTAALRTFVRGIAADSTRVVTRAAVRAAQMTLDARREGVRIARAEFMPTVNAFFQTGFTALPASGGFPTVWGHTSPNNCAPGAPASQSCQNNGWYPDRSFGLQVQWFWFDGLRAKGSVDLASANERIARTQLDLQRETVAAEMARANAEFARAEATFDAQRQNASEADEAYRIAALRFERGLGTQLEVSDAQFALFTARVNAARANIDYYLAAAELARARGHDVPLPPTRPASR